MRRPHSLRFKRREQRFPDNGEQKCPSSNCIEVAVDDDVLVAGANAAVAELLALCKACCISVATQYNNSLVLTSTPEDWDLDERLALALCDSLAHSTPLVTRDLVGM